MTRGGMVRCCPTAPLHARQAAAAPRLTTFLLACADVGAIAWMAVERRRPEHDYGAGTGGRARPSSSKRRMTSHLSPPAHSVTDPSRTCPPTQYGRHTIVTGARPPSPTRSPSYDAPRAHAPVPVPGCACLLHAAGHRCNAAAALGTTSSRRPQEPHAYYNCCYTLLSLQASAPHQPPALASGLTFKAMAEPLH